MVQILLKQGQVEVDTEDLTADYSDSVLLHRSVVEDLNNTIRVLKKTNITQFPPLASYAYWHFISWEPRQYYSGIQALNNVGKHIFSCRL